MRVSSSDVVSVDSLPAFAETKGRGTTRGFRTTHRTRMARTLPQKNVTSLVRAYRDRLRDVEKIPITRTILFGSHAKRTARRWSDIDVCFLASTFRNPLAVTEKLLIQRNRDEVLAGIEPVGFTEEDFGEGSAMIDEIKRTGVRIR